MSLLDRIFGTSTPEAPKTVDIVDSSAWFPFSDPTGETTTERAAKQKDEQNRNFAIARYLDVDEEIGDEFSEICNDMMDD